MTSKGKNKKNKDLISELIESRENSDLGGGLEKIENQHSKGKMTARERIDVLFDKGSFREIDALMTHRQSDFGLDQKKIPGDSVVIGFGKINDRMVGVFSQDPTVMGGSFSEVQGQKVAKIFDLALDSGVPVVGLMDSVGARIQ
ncbi:MAG: carboxyl transferase domain-containing protein, partial [Anaerolineales bacterium]